MLLAAAIRPAYSALNVGRFVALGRRLHVTRQAGRPSRSDSEQHHCEDPVAQTRTLHTKAPFEGKHHLGERTASTLLLSDLLRWEKPKWTGPN